MFEYLCHQEVGIRQYGKMVVEKEGTCELNGHTVYTKSWLVGTSRHLSIHRTIHYQPYVALPLRRDISNRFLPARRPR